MMAKGWIGVDLDGTLAHYDDWVGVWHIGKPIQKMLDRVKMWLAEGEDVRIFTARVSVGKDRDPNVAKKYIDEWCIQHIGRTLPVTNVKDFGMRILWDDRVVAVEKNTGEIIG